jgi:hypothetical protein
MRSLSARLPERTGLRCVSQIIARLTTDTVFQAKRALQHLMDDSDRKILEFNRNISSIRKELNQLSVQNIEISMLRIEKKIDNLIASTSSTRIFVEC